MLSDRPPTVGRDGAAAQQSVRYWSSDARASRFDATAAAVAEAEAQRRFDEAPAMFDGATRGFFARVAAAEAWSDEHGHFDCLRRSHAWRAEIGGGPR